MSKFYYLSTCSTCKRIIKELDLQDIITLIDIKNDPLTENDIKELYSMTGSYEALINKRARIFKEKGIDTSRLKEEDYKELLSNHYTFLKRPILLLENVLFIGNSKQTVANAKSFLRK
jgi:arsenate reductase-like glutaredoxin family protein